MRVRGSGKKGCMRTIVVSDVHGYPELIENALAHAGFRKGEDRLIFAGDFLDGGPGAERAFELIEELADVALIGNHELAAMLGEHIQPQDESSFGFADRLVGRVLGTGSGDSEGSNGAGRANWRLVTAEQGVLVAHSCVSREFLPEFEATGGDLDAFAERLNVEFRELAGAVASRPLADSADIWERRLFGMEGPLWYRPFIYGRNPPLEGIVQIVGHTAPELYPPSALRKLELLGIHLVAPDPREMEWGDADPDWLARAYRYGVIEDGTVRVESSAA
jgi:hypothetical protein